MCLFQMCFSLRLAQLLYFISSLSLFFTFCIFSLNRSMFQTRLKITPIIGFLPPASTFKQQATCGFGQHPTATHHQLIFTLSPSTTQDRLRLLSSDYAIAVDTHKRRASLYVQVNVHDGSSSTCKGLRLQGATPHRRPCREEKNSGRDQP